MTKELEGMKDITLTQNKVTVLGSLNDARALRSRPSLTSSPSSDTLTFNAQTTTKGTGTFVVVFV